MHLPRLTRVERERTEHKKKLLALATEHEQVVCMNSIRVGLYSVLYAYNNLVCSFTLFTQ